MASIHSPRSISYHSVSDPQPSTELPASHSDNRRSKLKILLVEDNLINQKVTLKQLQSLGYLADVVANGQEAIDVLAQIHYDIVLMDCQMPVLDGYSATRRIRHLEQQQSLNRTYPVIVIAMTANALQRDRDRAIAVGMDDYLSKPVRRDILAAMLERWIQKIPFEQDAENLSCCKLSSDSSISSDSSTASETSSPLDWEHLHQISDYNPDFELELLNLFVKDSQTHLEGLKAAIATHDFATIEQQAHHIKGASANVGARQMQRAAGQLEEDAHQQNMANAEHLVAAIEAGLGQVQAWIESRSQTQ